MAFLIVGDVVSPVVFRAFAASAEPPIQGVVTTGGATPVVAWQDGREQTFTSDAGLVQVAIDSSPAGIALVNQKVFFSAVPGPSGRNEGIVVLVVNVTDVFATTTNTAVVRFSANGLYVAIPTAALTVSPSQ